MKCKSLPRRMGNNEVEVTTHGSLPRRIMKWKSLENNEVEVTTQEGGE